MAGEARRPSLGEQVVGLVGEERPDRPVYMAGDPRTPFTPLPLSRRTPSVGGAGVGGRRGRRGRGTRSCIHVCECAPMFTRAHGGWRQQRVKREDLRNGDLSVWSL